MASNYLASTNNNEDDRVIAGTYVSKRIWKEYHVFHTWMTEKTFLVHNLDRFERTWLDLVRNPRFQDKHLRRRQAEKVIRSGTGGVCDFALMGRLLTMRCLAGAGRVNKRKSTRHGGKVRASRELLAVKINDEVERAEYEILQEEDWDDSTATGSDVGAGDGVEIGRIGQIEQSGYESDEGNDYPGEDDNSGDESEAPTLNTTPSSPSPKQNLLLPKTPAHQRVIAQLPTPDSTPFAQFLHAPSLHLPSPWEDSEVQKLRRENEELSRRIEEKDGQMQHLSAELRGRHYDAEVMGAELSRFYWMSR